ncbi:hypothetical protein RIF29_13313 [Crotalaria pallida]|uniref:Low-temperature-induced 65 kDa protein n=1 Tax=Crotalaria pallida TaxID=3830 RepID=A0AAN9IPE7_CROPI
MDSRAVQSHHAHESHQVAHGEEGHQQDHEKKSVLKKVKAKAKKIKDKVTGHGHHDHEHGHDQYHYENQHIPDDHDLDEEDDEDEEPEVHGAPIYDSAAVRSGTPGQVHNRGKPGTNFGGTTAMVEPHHHEPRVVVLSPTTGVSQSRVTDPARTFVGDMGVQHKVNLETPMGLEEDPHAPRSTPLAHAPANYQTKVTDPTKAGGAEIDITPIQSSLANMAIHNEPKHNQEPKVLPPIAETQTQHPLSGSHHHFLPELSTPTKTPYPTAQTHDHNMPHLSSEVKNQYPRSHDQHMPNLHDSTKTQYPYTSSHDHSISGPSATKTHYHSTGIHDQHMPDLHGSTKTHYPSAGIHDQHMPEYHGSTKTHYPSTEIHDQHMPGLHDSTKTHYPSTISHDKNMPDFSSATNTHYPSAGIHDQHMPELHGSTKSHYSSAGSHDQHMPELQSSTKTHYPSTISHDQNISDLSSATKTNYPSAGSHDQFVPDRSTQTKPNYTSSENEAKFMNEHIPTSTNAYSVGERPQHQHYESMEKPSNESSYTEKISSATSAIADKAIAAKNVVASKLGYGEKEDARDHNQTRYHEENISGEKPSNQSSYTEKISSATSAIADKAASAKDAVASKLGYGEKDDNTGNKSTAKTATTTQEEKERENSNTTNTAADYGKNIALSLTEKLAPVYGKVAGVGSAVKSKIPGTERESSVSVEQDKGVSVKEYLVDKLMPGVEDKALSEVISESLHKKKEEPNEVRDVKNVISDAVHKREAEEPIRGGHRPLGKVTESEEVKMRLGSDERAEKLYEESYVNSPGEGVVDKLKNVVGSLFVSDPEEKQSSQVAGGGDLTKNSGAGVEHVGQAEGYTLLVIQSHDKKLQPEPCGEKRCVHGTKAFLLYASIYLLALGGGGIRGSVPAPGADQFDENSPKERVQLCNIGPESETHTNPHSPKSPSPLEFFTLLSHHPQKNLMFQMLPSTPQAVF